MTTNSSDASRPEPTGRRSRWVVSFLLLLIVLYACARLGWWQWQRAAEFKAAEQPVADAPRVPLAQVTRPLINLPFEAEGRLVSVEGSYERAWLVRERQSGSRIDSWQVALLRLPDESAILVVRGWEPITSSLPTGTVRVEGRLMPSQNPELSVPVDGDGELSRVDPALVLDTGDLYDGYIIASDEEPPNAAIERVPAPEVRKSPPGYYLQHVAYIVLWWFFGLVALVVWIRAFREERRAGSLPA
jgi:cytochrome oxidase assembly protein ShyY1